MLKSELHPALAPTEPGLTAPEKADTLPAPGGAQALAATADGHDIKRGSGLSAGDLLLVSIPGSIPAPLQSWDRYEIIRPLGQGGMGSVFLARDRRLGRMVALKFLRVPSPEAAERLMQEARAQARLAHNNICKVFEVGEFLSQPYIAMEFINGQPLYTAVQRLSLEQKVVLLRQIALAVHAAHSQGVLHRDLKPANVMVCAADASEQTPGLLRPVLMDFGLARDSLGPQRLTQTGIIMGTPHYMAPEQARGQARHLDRRADVYSLGAMLYELLTGRPPFDCENEVDLLLSVLNQDPQPPRSVDASVPVDLEVITLKCLCKEPEQRYDSAQALADDLQRYLHSEPIVARPASTLYRLRRMALRHRARVVVAVVIAGSLCALLGVTLRARTQQRLAAQQAERQRQRAKQQEELAGSLGQAVTEMKLFLRVAYSLPPHDLGREQKVVRLRLGKLEQKLGDTEPFLRGTIESALGEGYLALHEYEPAVEHLQHALALGQQTAEVHLAMGQAQGLLYEQKRNELRARSEIKPGDPELDKLKQRYLGPARQELALGSGAALTTPAYVTALSHFYNGEADYDQALAFARTAQADAPWLIEPLAIEIKIVTEQLLSKFQHGQRDLHVESAAVRDTIIRAIGIARSYPDFYHHYASYSYVFFKNSAWSGNPAQDVAAHSLEAIANAKTAVTLMPKSSDSYNQLAAVYTNIVYAQGMKHIDPQDMLKEGMAAVEQALKISPRQAQSYVLRGRMYDVLANYLDDNGEDQQPAAERAVQDKRRATELEPNDFNAWQTAAISMFRLAECKEKRGEPWQADVQSAIAAAEHAQRLQPENFLPRSNLITLHLKLASSLSEKGQAPDAEFATIHALFRQIEQKNGDNAFLALDKLELELAEVEALLNQDQDAVAAARELLAKTFALAAENPKSHDDQMLQIGAYKLYIKALLAQEQAAGPALDAAIAAVDHTTNAAMTATQRDLQRTELLLLRVRSLMQSGRSPESDVRTVLAATAPTAPMAQGPMRQRTLAARTQVLCRWGEWLLTQHRMPAAKAAIGEGLLVYAAALTNQRSASLTLQAVYGVLLALQAQVSAPGERAARATQAVATLTHVLQEQPPLGRELQPYLQAALKLTPQAGKTAPF